jgi:sucrose-6-phosphate hydrolase SacC (GH32 family)
LIGDFDGNHFINQSGPLRDLVGANYAAQTFSDIPPADGRRIQIAWMRGGQYPGMPFDQQMSFPVTLRLRRFPEGLKLTQEPIAELSKLHDQKHTWSGRLGTQIAPFPDLQIDACEIRATIDSDRAKALTFNVCGQNVSFETATRRLSTSQFSSTLPTNDRRLRLVILVDRTSLEVFAQDGRLLLTECFVPKTDEHAIKLTGAGANVESLECWTLTSSWRGSQ